MARTFADMTPEKREQCVGMWANISSRDELFIIDSVDSETALVFIPGDSPDAGLIDFDVITPRFDLMPTRNPDGTPIKGEWVEGHMWWGEDTDTMEPVDVVGAECLATGHIQGFDQWPDGVTPGEDVPVQRFITEWGATNE